MNYCDNPLFCVALYRLHAYMLVCGGGVSLFAYEIRVLRAAIESYLNTKYSCWYNMKESVIKQEGQD